MILFYNICLKSNLLRKPLKLPKKISSFYIFCIFISSQLLVLINKGLHIIIYILFYSNIIMYVPLHQLFYLQNNIFIIHMKITILFSIYGSINYFIFILGMACYNIIKMNVHFKGSLAYSFISRYLECF